MYHVHILYLLLSCCKELPAPGTVFSYTQHLELSYCWFIPFPYYWFVPHSDFFCSVVHISILPEFFMLNPILHCNMFHCFPFLLHHIHHHPHIYEMDFHLWALRTNCVLPMNGLTVPCFGCALCSDSDCCLLSFPCFSVQLFKARVLFFCLSGLRCLSVEGMECVECSGLLSSMWDTLRLCLYLSLCKNRKVYHVG